MYKSFAIILSILLLFTFTGCGTKDGFDKVETGLYQMAVEDSYKLSISQLGDDVMPVAIYVSPMPEHGSGFERVPSQINDRYYQLIKEAGVNFVYGHSENGEDIFKNLDLCEKHGLAYLLRTDHMEFFKDTDNGIICYPDYSVEEQQRVKKAFIDAITPYADHPAFAGIKFSDEVGTKCFPGLQAATEIFYEEFPGKMIYHNLLGNLASGQMLESAPYFQKYTQVTDEGILKDGYDYHIRKFTETVDVEYISFDNYPIQATGTVAAWGRNLSQVINLANEKGIAFWNFIQAATWGDPAFVEPSETDLLWQNNLSLAFGCKGLQMFTFFCPVDFLQLDLAGTSKHCIDSNGNVTDLYYAVKNSLSQISMMDEVLMNSKWKGIMTSTTGIPATIIPETDVLESFNHLDSIVSTDAHVVTGCFNYQGKTALLVVNNSVMSPTNVVLNFNVGTKGYYVKDNAKFEFTSKNKQLVIPYLVAGGAALVVID